MASQPQAAAASLRPSVHAAFLAAYFRELDRRGVRYCITRNFERLPDEIDGDVDILVRPGQRARAEAALDDALPGHFVVRRVERDGHLLVFITSAEELRSATREGRAAAVVEIDLVTQLAWSGLHYQNAIGVLSRARERAGSWVAHPADEAAHVLCHAILDKNQVKPGYRAVLERACQQLGDAAFEPLERCAGAGIVARLREVSASGDDASLLALRSDLIRALITRRPLGLLRFAAHHASVAARRVRAVLQPPGVLIATAGPDGAGKSTLLAQLGSVLDEIYHPIRDQYMGWRDFVLPTKKLLGWLQRTLAARKSPDATAAAAAASAVPEPEYSHEPDGPMSWTHNFSVLHYFADLFARYVLQIRPALHRGGLVLCDRYFFDVLVQEVWICENPTPRALLVALTPRPTVTALLSGDAEVIAARKREISPERTTDQMQSLSVLSGSKGVLALDALKPLDENVEAVLKRLFPSWSEAR